MIIGLTGSIAMGKSTVAQMFQELGCPVFDADKTVHELYQKGGQATIEIEKLLPDVIVNGKIDRQALAKKISQDQAVLPRIESIVHPMIHSLEKRFVLDNERAGIKIMILDIPLLFEADRTKDVDVVVVVSATKEQQRTRALRRPNMTEEKLDLILSRQLSDQKKRARADYVIDTSTTIKETFAQVKTLVEKLMSN